MTDNKKKYVVIGGAVAAAVIIAVVASSFSSQASSGSGLTTASGKENVQGLQVGDSAPGFSLRDPEKGSITKQTFAGKPVLIFFTTTWCTPCQIGAQNLARLDDKTGGNAFNVLIVFVDPRETDQQYIDWKDRYGRSDWYVAESEQMPQEYKVRYLDTKYVFDSNGIIKWVDVNPLEYSKAKQVLEPFLA
ncbi:TlpA family protein disulfide reductase [Nitrososphaera viennensis]|uniref:Alkyl hydroperoxide reductase/ thiol specific antioxidant family protein n=2 Tax=Nitrososphaera viennensis TaxID=1034015 RepID=A0A060HPM8_9ARCH|nr:TlpA disulfide reductase family protein [Nitrososphaera viennensis]AIC15501.1 alkyl hydroperoxide reductase/ thiol specific antioxidant family protein [Nitrososphaera viennensis EN76]UVS70388.1 TlpA family protein disulfide reductase [Nitrososphaera viennensis]